MKFLVLGGGAQGSAAAFDLVQREDVEQVVVADRDLRHPRPFLQPYLPGGDDARAGRLRLQPLDAKDHGAVREAMHGVDAVVCALPYFFNFDMARLAVESDAHYSDLGGNTEIVEQQRTLDEEARERGVSVIPDCGLAPGMVNILAQMGIDALDETRSVKIRVGGLPQKPRPPLNYKIVYSMQGVLDYYTTLSVVLQDGRLVQKEALSEIEPVRFPEPVGELEAFHTAGGISTMPWRYQNQIPHMEYKTLRYPGHAGIMKAIRELGLLSLEPVEHGGHPIVPRDFFIDVVTPRLRDPGGQDLVALRVEVQGMRQGTEQTLRWDLLDYYDEENDVSAMMRTTGYSLAITGLLQARGEVKEAGVRTPDEAMPGERYVELLADRGIGIERAEASGGEG